MHISYIYILYIFILSEEDGHGEDYKWADLLSSSELVFRYSLRGRDSGIPKNQ